MQNDRRMPNVNVSMSAEERERLERLAGRLGGVPNSRAVAIAIAHTLTTLERREPLHTLEPGEEVGK